MSSDDNTPPRPKLEPFARLQSVTDRRREILEEFGATRDQMRSRRKREVRALTVVVSRITKRELKRERLLNPDIDHPRPRTREECVEVIRPCPFVGCRYHLFLDVAPNGNIKLNFPDLEPDDLSHSCVLDVADDGGETLEDVGALMN